MIIAPNPQLRSKFLGIVNKFLSDGGQRDAKNDKTMISKTSPTIWEYEMFRMEWTRRAVLRALYEMLREDTRLRRANQVFASTGVRRGFDLVVTSDVSQAEAARAQQILTDFRRRIKLNSKLAPWARVLLRDGDIFLNPIVDFTNGQIVQVKSLPAITIQRNDDITGNFPNEAEAFQQIDPISLQPELELGIWQVNHMRWTYEEGERYGKSQYLGCLRSWKQLNMMEQDLVIRRRTRAAPKRIHIVGDKNHPGGEKELDAYIARNHLDGSVKDIVSDYFMNGLGDVKDLNPDAMLDHIKDIIYAQEVYMIGSGVPLHILGFGQNVNRDIISDQKAQFEEDVQELRNIIEYGDSGAYSGLRSMFDLELALHGIDPGILDYNVVWFENNNETANDRVDRVIQLRSAQPIPVISWKTALRVIAKDVGFDDQTAMDQEMAAVKEEYEYIQQVTALNKTAPNPIVPMEAPLSKEISRHAGNVVLDSEGRQYIALDALQKLSNSAGEVTGNGVVFPLHNNPQLGAIESQIQADVKNHIGVVGTQFLNNHMPQMVRLASAGLNPDTASVVMDATVPFKLDSYSRVLMRAALDDENDDDDNHDDNQENNNAYIKSQIDVPSVLLPLLSAFKQEADEANESLSQHLFKHYLKIDRVTKEEAYRQTKHPAITPGLTSTEQEQLLQYLAKNRVQKIMNTTYNMLADQFEQAWNNDEPIEKWIERAKSVLDVPDWRSKMIGRTETANAFNETLKHTYKSLGIEQVRWQAVIDNKTCATCADNDGKVFNIDNIPDPGIPAHPNCRCTLVSV